MGVKRRAEEDGAQVSGVVPGVVAGPLAVRGEAAVGRRAPPSCGSTAAGRPLPDTTPARDGLTPWGLGFPTLEGARGLPAPAS